ncbi:MAG: serine/threonine-protein kinase [Cocleimonas sp.]
MKWSALLIDDESVSQNTNITSLLESKVQNISIQNISISAFKTKQKEEGTDLSDFDVCITSDRVTAISLRSNEKHVVYWESLSDLSSQIDVSLQLSRTTKQFPLDLKDWKLVEVLHNSKDAIIYRAVDKNGLVAAIKRFKFTSQQLSKETIKHFLDRVKRQCGLRSKRLVHIFDGGICDNTFYLVMEYLQYGTLRQTIDGCDKKLPLIHALLWFEEIVLALDSVHQASLVHRDLKIDNIMLRDDGSLALTDYGISKRILLDAGFLDENELHCSPHYVSPEQVNGEVCTQASDIYSLGVIFYELLTGEKPYSGKQAFELMMQHVMAPVPTLPNDYSQYQSMVDKMMAKNPDDRYVSAVNAIENLIKAA